MPSKRMNGVLSLLPDRGSFEHVVTTAQPRYRQLMGLPGCFILVGPQTLLFALGAGNFQDAVGSSLHQCWLSAKWQPVIEDGQR